MVLQMVLFSFFFLVHKSVVLYVVCYGHGTSSDQVHEFCFDCYTFSSSTTAELQNPHPVVNATLGSSDACDYSMNAALADENEFFEPQR